MNDTLQKREIIEAAEFLLLQKNHYDLDLSMVARQCGIGKARLYSIFGNKENIVAELVAYFCQKEMQVIASALENGNNNKEQQTIFFACVFALLEKLPYLTYLNFTRKSQPSKTHFEDFKRWIKQQ